jgi:hypothetical protein
MAMEVSSLLNLLSLLGPGQAMAGGVPGQSEGPFPAVAPGFPPVPPPAGWEASYQPDVGTASVGNQLKRFNTGSSIVDEQLRKVGPTIGAALRGVGTNFLNPPDVAPIEVSGARTPPDLPTASEALKTPVPENTVSPLPNHENLNLGKIAAEWAAKAPEFKLSTDIFHPGWGFDLPNKLAAGWTPGFDRDGKFGLTNKDGGFLGLNPNNAPFVGPPPPPPPAVTAAPTAPAPATPVPTFGQMLGVAKVGAAPPVATSPDLGGPPPAPALAVPSEAPNGMPQTGVQFLNAGINPTPNDMPGKIMAAGGMIASALDPKRFGQAGEMMSTLGQKEVARERGNAAARLAGYPSVEAMEAAKTEAGIRRTATESRLDVSKAAMYDADVAQIAERIPSIAAERGLTVAKTDAQRIANDNARKMGPLPFTIGGNTYMLTPEQQAHFQLGMLNSNIHYQSMLANNARDAATVDKIRQEIAKGALNIPVTVPNPTTGGQQQVMMDTDQYIRHRAATLGAVDKGEARRLKAYEDLIKPVVKHYSEALPGMAPAPLSANWVNAVEKQALDFIASGDSFWVGQGQAALLLIGKSANPAPSASQSLRGAPGVLSPSHNAWGQAPPKR